MSLDVAGKGIHDLLTCPARRRTVGDVDMHDAASFVFEHHEDVEKAEGHCRHDEEVDGDEILAVIQQERAPSLRRRLSVPHHLLADAGLADLDAGLEQFAVEARCSPERVLNAHPSDQHA